MSRRVSNTVSLCLDRKEVELIVLALRQRARVWAFEANLFKEGRADGPAFESAAKKYDQHMRLARLVDGDPTVLEEL